jgi:hypothetical protein
MVLSLQCQARCTLLTINSSRSAEPGELCGSECIQGKYTVKTTPSVAVAGIKPQRH